MRSRVGHSWETVAGSLRHVCQGAYNSSLGVAVLGQGNISKNNCRVTSRVLR
jgi:hypothetical protein